MDKRTQRGFTLYELLITVLIVGVILSFGVPNMREFTQNSRITSTANDLHAAFHLARSESSRAKTNITICPSADASSCGGTWSQGYIVFVDADGDLARAGATETVLRSHGPAADGISLAVAGDATYFSYSSTGLGRPNVGGNTALSQVIVCDARGEEIAAGGYRAHRLLVVTPLGRATIVRDTNTSSTISDALTAMNKTCP